MRCLSPASRVLLTALTMIVALSLACSSDSGNAADEVAATQTSPAQSLGVEIGETYGKLVLDARQIVEPRPPAAEARGRLRLLRNEYKVLFGNYGCLRATFDDNDLPVIDNEARKLRDNYASDVVPALEEAARDYDFEDTAIAPLLRDIATLDDYVYIEQVETRRPGEVVLCEG
jgi:hypothetical protein